MVDATADLTSLHTLILCPLLDQLEKLLRRQTVCTKASWCACMTQPAHC